MKTHEKYYMEQIKEFIESKYKVVYIDYEIFEKEETIYLFIKFASRTVTIVYKFKDFKDDKLENIKKLTEKQIDRDIIKRFTK